MTGPGSHSCSEAELGPTRKLSEADGTAVRPDTVEELGAAPPGLLALWATPQVTEQPLSLWQDPRWPVQSDEPQGPSCFSRARPPLLIPKDSGWGPPSGPLKNGSLEGAAPLDTEGPDQHWK